MRSKSRIKYLFQLPTAVPTNRILVHNSAPHSAKTVPGMEDFRAWFYAGHSDYMLCSCGWAAHLGPHYCEAPEEV